MDDANMKRIGQLALQEIHRATAKATTILAELPENSLDVFIEAGKQLLTPDELSKQEGLGKKINVEERRAFVDMLLAARAFRSAGRAYAILATRLLLDEIEDKEAKKHG